MSPSKITLTTKLFLYSDTGTLKYVYAQSQYEFSGKEQRIVQDDIPDKEYSGKLRYHYVIDIDGENYYVPDIYAVEYDVPYESEYLFDKSRHEFNMASNERLEKNVLKVYKEALGRNIDVTYKPEEATWYREMKKQSTGDKNPSKDE